MILVVFLLSIFIFLLVSMIPGDPVYAMLGEEVSPEEYNRVFHELKLDQPVIVRYFSWLADALHGDLGESTQFHMKTSEVLAARIPITLFFSIAAFADDAVLAVQQEEDSVEQLVHFREVRRNIRRQRQMLLAWDDVRYYAGTILCANLDTPQARQTHLEQIDNEIAYRNFALRNGLCPRCGGKLVLRHGTYGDFYGCSNYPACRYTLENET